MGFSTLEVDASNLSMGDTPTSDPLKFVGINDEAQPSLLEVKIKHSGRNTLEGYNHLGFIQTQLVHVRACTDHPRIT